MAGVLYFDGGGCFCYQELGACVVREVAKLKMALNNAVIYDESRYEHDSRRPSCV